MPRLLALAAVSRLAGSAQAARWPQHAPRGGGTRDLTLLYASTPDHYTTDAPMAYVAFADKSQNGRPLDWFCDSHPFATVSVSSCTWPSEPGAAALADWRAFPGLGFEPRMNLQALDDAISRTAEAHGPRTRPPVVLMVPHPSPEHKHFGVVEGSAHSLNLSRLEEVRRGGTWMVDKSRRRFAAARLRHVKLWGLCRMKKSIRHFKRRGFCMGDEGEAYGPRRRRLTPARRTAVH